MWYEGMLTIGRHLFPTTLFDTATTASHDDRHLPPGWRGPLLAAVAFAMSTAAAFAAQAAGRPITSALVYVLGVTLIGSFAGVRSGVAAALAASVVYNFFLSQPVFRFGIATAEEYVPLIVFNCSAIVSGLLAGRLNDRAKAAEEAQRRLRRLFDISSRLQSAVRVSEIPAAVADSASDWKDDLELYVSRGSALEPLASLSFIEIANELAGSRAAKLVVDRQAAYLLGSSETPVGVLVLHGRDEITDGRFDVDAIVNLLSIAVERCLLLERLANTEAIKRSEQFKTSLISSVSHDMRTPLAAISASASSLSNYGEELGPAAQRGLLRTIETQCDRLNRYTTNLLNLGRIQSGLDIDTFAEVDAIEVLGAAIARAREYGPAHVIAKDIGLDFALVRADPVMLEQLFYNVLENAIRYSGKGTRIDVQAEPNGQSLIVSILDEGIGVAFHDLERIFDRFYRGGGAVLRDGSGLGLAISKGFADAFGGSIKAQSPLCSAGGTRIRIVLPLQARAARDEL